MKKIPLTQGQFALVDDADFEYLNQWKWYASQYKYTWYARRGNKGAKAIFMHRQILGLTDRKIQADHIDKNGLNNSRSNLRICNQTQNNANRSLSVKNKTSKYIGVRKKPDRKKYDASIKINYKRKHLGCFLKEEDAALAYNVAALKQFGEYATLNQLVVYDNRP